MGFGFVCAEYRGDMTAQQTPRPKCEHSTIAIISQKSRYMKTILTLKREIFCLNHDDAFSDVLSFQLRTWPFYVNFAQSWRKNFLKNSSQSSFLFENNLTWSSRLESQSYLQLSWPSFVRRQLLLLIPPFTEINAWWTVLYLKRSKVRNKEFTKWIWVILRHVASSPSCDNKCTTDAWT